MSNFKSQSKYRPQFTLAEIETIIACLHSSYLETTAAGETHIVSPADSNIRIPVDYINKVHAKLNTFKIKANVGLNSPSYITTREGRGRPSNNQLIKESFAQEIEERNKQGAEELLDNASQQGEAFTAGEIAYNKYCSNAEDCTDTEKELAIKYKAERKETLTAEEKETLNIVIMRDMFKP